MVRAAGLAYSTPEVSPRSLAALQVAEAARDAGRFEALHERLFRAHWVEGADIGEVATLRALAVDVGLDGARVDDAVGSDDLVRRVHAGTTLAQEIGVTGVPAWLIDRRVLLQGAQPHAVFDDALAGLGYRPVITGDALSEG